MNLTSLDGVYYLQFWVHNDSLKTNHSIKMVKLWKVT